MENHVFETSRTPSIGNSRLDDDHEQIAKLIEALGCASRDDMLNAFDSLREALAEHFSEENSLMEPHEFASKECHIDEHAEVLKSFDDVRPFVQSFDVTLVKRFVSELTSWLPAHIEALDRHLSKLVFFQQTGGARVAFHRRIAL